MHVKTNIDSANGMRSLDVQFLEPYFFNLGNSENLMETESRIFLRTGALLAARVSWRLSRERISPEYWLGP